MAKEAVSRMADIPGSLDELISPIPREDFLSRYYGKTFLHVPGRPGKFSNLFPWTHLNHVLEYHRLSPVRLRLFKDAEPISPRSYMYINDAGGARLRLLDLTRQLAAGATLVLDDADELYGPLRSLAARLERIFRVRVQANVYAGWRTQKGFDLHWDDHHVFILQVAGNKRWVLHEPTRPHPMKPDVEEAAKPGGLPAWEATLRDGDFLYIPRGWWHMAVPLDEPCMHVTVSIKSQTGLDLLHWFVNTLRTSDVVRQDLPHLASTEEQAAYMSRLTAALAEGWGVDALRRFLAEGDEQVAPRLHAQLPHAASPKAPPLDPTQRLKLAAPRRINFIPDHARGIVHCTCYGKQWEFDRVWLPFLELLNEDGEDHTLEELMARTPVEPAQVERFVHGLIQSGLLIIENDRRGGDAAPLSVS